MSKKEVIGFKPEKLKIGDKVSFIVDKKKVTITVDQDFLNIPIEKPEFYKKYGYKVEK